MPKPVYALVGSDTFLQLQELADVLALFASDIARTDFDGEQAQLAEVFDELRSFAMFGGARVIVMKNTEKFLTEFRSQMEDYLASPTDTSTLILRFSSLPKSQRVYKAIQSVGEIRDCNAPKEVVPWIIARAKKAHALTMTQPVARQLFDLVGDDLGRLDNEIAKLAINSEDGKVDGSKVVQMVAFQREQEMWDMTNELAAGHTEVALRRFRQLQQMDSSTEFRAVTWLTMWLEKVRKATHLKASGASDQSIASTLRIFPPPSVGPFLKTVSALGAAGTSRAIDLLTQVDRQSKTGVGDALANVERFILTIGAACASNAPPVSTRN